MNRELQEKIEKLEKQLEYCIREELYEKAAKIFAEISQYGQSKVPIKFDIKNSKDFANFLNKKKTS